jgi:hypothetical protein
VKDAQQPESGQRKHRQLLKNAGLKQKQWFMSVIPATQEADIERMVA